MITLREIVEAVPGVAVVLGSVARVQGDGYWGEYSRYKGILRTLVGWSAPAYGDDMLNSHWAYDVVIEALLDALDGVLVLPGKRKARAG